MIAESGGRDQAKNPRSTAVGPFQFIESTWLDVARRHFAKETANLQPAQILALRTDRTFARRAAEAYTRDNVALLRAQGHSPTYGTLRLAFFAGYGGAHRVLSAQPESRSVAILGPGVGKANPFLFGMTVADLKRRMGRDVGALADVVFEGPAPTVAQVEAIQAATAAKKLTSIPKPYVVRCNQALPACRRWVALAERRTKAPQPVARAAAPAKASPKGQKRSDPDRVLARR
jgi:hypothetical protein